MEVVADKAALLAAKPMTREIHVESWGCTVMIKPLSAKERIAVQQLAAENDEYGNEKMVAMSLCDANGVRILGDTDDDADVIVDKPAIGTEQIIAEIQKLNSVSDDKQKKGTAESPQN